MEYEGTKFLNLFKKENKIRMLGTESFVFWNRENLQDAWKDRIPFAGHVSKNYQGSSNLNPLHSLITRMKSSTLLPMEIHQMILVQ